MPELPTNPWWSSLGSVAACAAGCCDIAIGSDTGGSVRVPAVYGWRHGDEVLLSLAGRLARYIGIAA